MSRVAALVQRWTLCPGTLRSEVLELGRAWLRAVHAGGGGSLVTGHYALQEGGTRQVPRSEELPVTVTHRFLINLLPSADSAAIRRRLRALD